ncbi:MAG TPA: hypothetical protein VMU09_12990, partial [Acidimicrobiales bacterium]|nr:hypothetical protein [Acidimicrobiales bacterium]
TVPDKEPVWIRAPLVIRAPYLRWALYRGDTLEGIRWALGEEADRSSFHVLQLAAQPSAADLVEALTPIVGRPIADTLADLATEAAPAVVSA